MIQKRVLAVLGGLFLTGCSSLSGIFEGEQAPTNISPAGAFVVGDEAQAVTAGAAVLAEGGSAADAATAIYFAMATTYPVAAGLGGGGVCLVRSSAGNVETFAFLTRDSKGGGPYALPGNVRGFWALQHAYGKLAWDRLIAPAETLATSGFPISDALETRLNASLDILRLDPNLAYEFLDDNGNLKPAGTVITNPDIAKTLAAIRTQGSDGSPLTPGGVNCGAPTDHCVVWGLPTWNGAYGELDGSIFFKFNDDKISIGLEAQNLNNAVNKVLMQQSFGMMGRAWFQSDRRYTASVRVKF